MLLTKKLFMKMVGLEKKLKGDHFPIVGHNKSKEVRLVTWLFNMSGFIILFRDRRQS